MRQGWEAAGPRPDEPDDERLARAVFEVVREANAAGAWQELRPRFPAAHAPFASWMSRKGRRIYAVAWVDEDHLAAAVGDAFEREGVFVFGVDGSISALPGVLAFARSHDGAFTARVMADGIEVTSGWNGPRIAWLQHPSGLEGTPAEFPIEPATVHDVDEILVDSEGEHVVVLRRDGIFVVSQNGARRLHPSEDDMRTELLEAREDEPDRTSFRLHYDMAHAAVSPTESVALVGSQCLQQELVALDGERLGRFGPIASEYGHHAAFSPDGEFAIVNACHFYNGVTLGAPVSRLRGLHSAEFKRPKGVFTTIDKGCRVYASAFHSDAVLLGDAYGYVRAFTRSGKRRWQHHCGSSIGGISISPSGTRMAVGTYAGMLHLIELDASERDPFQIGTASHRELLRFILWKGEPMLRW